jgi:hypothetical protein
MLIALCFATGNAKAAACDSGTIGTSCGCSLESCLPVTISPNDSNVSRMFYNYERIYKNICNPFTGEIVCVCSHPALSIQTSSDSCYYGISSTCVINSSYYVYQYPNDQSKTIELFNPQKSPTNVGFCVADAIIKCKEGYYGTLTSESSVCSSCPGGYPNSVLDSKTIDSCYRACNISDIANSQFVTGSKYYDGSGSCNLVSCQSGYHKDGNICVQDYVPPSSCQSGYYNDGGGNCVRCPAIGKDDQGNLIYGVNITMGDIAPCYGTTADHCCFAPSLCFDSNAIYYDDTGAFVFDEPEWGCVDYSDMYCPYTSGD